MLGSAYKNELKIIIALIILFLRRCGSEKKKEAAIRIIIIEWYINQWIKLFHIEYVNDIIASHYLFSHMVGFYLYEIIGNYLTVNYYCIQSCHNLVWAKRVSIDRISSKLFFSPPPPPQSVHIIYYLSIAIIQLHHMMLERNS